jgi:pimeloyl-ACP methyl ester carboxylesterase
MPQPLLEIGGNPANPLMTIAPANGFVPETYLPMLRPFIEEYRVVSVPPRPLWGDEIAPEPSPSQSWESLADDLLAAYEAFGLKEIIAVGHSFGGIASLLAALKKPEYFKAIVLLDPTIVSRQVCEWIRQAIASEQTPIASLVESARRRRNQFESIEDTYNRFKGKSVFADWDDEALKLYAEFGTVANEDGSRRLAWSPDWEAFYFSIYYADIWNILPKANNLDIPLLLIAGGASDTYVPDVAQEVAELLPNATHRSIAGHGHLFPQSAPLETAAVIKDWLEKTV